jgi:homoserine kinase type II
LAVYTELEKNELIKFLSLYNIGTLISFSGIAEGIENSNFFLITTTGKFILTIFEKRVDKKDLPFFTNIMTHLNNKNFMCPKPIIDKTGNSIQNLCEKSAIIVNFLEGKSKTKFTIDDCFLVGSTMSTMHTSSKDFKLIRKNSLSFSGWQVLINECKTTISKKTLDTIDLDILNEVQKSYNFCRDHWPNNLPVGFIHADMFPDNVFFIKNKISGLIDFYFSCIDLLAYDLAIAINAWCFDQNHIFDREKFNSLIDGYQSVRNLSEKEIIYLPILCQASALRFLLTRMYDWAHTPQDAIVIPKKPDEYLKKLRFHKEIKTTSDYGI